MSYPQEKLVPEEMISTSANNPESFSRKDYLRFIIPSLLGVIFFLVPVVYDGKTTIIMGVVVDAFNAAVGSGMTAVILVIVTISGVLTPVCTYLKPDWLMSKKTLAEIFCTSHEWVALRVLGMVFSYIVFWEIGPEWLHGEKTGHVMLYEYAGVIIGIFLFAALMLPFLTEYGLMEFIGSLVRKPFKKIFKLPGQAAVDAVASWMAAASVGVLITAQQYEKGYYSGRESAVIATNFSVVSIAYSIFIVKFVNLEHLFFPYYLTCVFLGLVLAFIIPRLPPLSRKKDEYNPEVGKQISEGAEFEGNAFQRSVYLAVSRAQRGPGPKNLIKAAATNVADIWFGLLPAAMAITLFVMILVKYTAVVNWLSAPLIPLLELLQLPEAAAAAPAMIAGFGEMFIPVIIGRDIESEITRFVIACISVVQLVYMSEVGMLLLKSKIPLNFWDLLIIFCLRTIIALPLAAGIAHFIIF